MAVFRFLKEDILIFVHICNILYSPSLWPSFTFYSVLISSLKNTVFGLLDQLHVNYIYKHYLLLGEWKLKCFSNINLSLFPFSWVTISNKHVLSVQQSRKCFYTNSQNKSNRGQSTKNVFDTIIVSVKINKLIRLRGNKW